MGVCSSHAAAADSPPTMEPNNMIHVQTRADAPARKKGLRSKNGSGMARAASSTSLDEARLSAEPHDSVEPSSHGGETSADTKPKALASQGSSSPHPPASPVLAPRATLPARGQRNDEFASSPSSTVAAPRQPPPPPQPNALSSQYSMPSTASLQSLPPSSARSSRSHSPVSPAANRHSPIQSPKRSQVGIHRPPSLSPLPLHPRNTASHESSVVSTDDVQTAVCSCGAECASRPCGCSRNQPARHQLTLSVSHDSFASNLRSKSPHPELNHIRSRSSSVPPHPPLQHAHSTPEVDSHRNSLARADSNVNLSNSNSLCSSPMACPITEESVTDCQERSGRPPRHSPKRTLIQDEFQQQLETPPALSTLSHSKTVPANMHNLCPLRQEELRQSSAGSRDDSAPPTFFCTKSIERGLTQDGWFHINQYIMPVSSRKRAALAKSEEAVLRRDARRRRLAALEAGETARLEVDTSSLQPQADEVVDDKEEDANDDHDDEDGDDDDDDDDDDEAILGRGSYGLVKKVFNTQDNTFYAMKIISKSLLSRSGAFGRQNGESAAVESIKREIAIMKKLDHPNIVRLYEVMCDEAAQSVYMIMHYAVNGPVMTVDLDEGEQEIEPGKWNIVAQPLPLPLARKYFRDVLSGLDYLHHQRVIHRDIKPENILVHGRDPHLPLSVSPGRAMIADFGVSTLCEGDECLVASTAGTAAFMSPEMVKSGAKSAGFGGTQTDVWSLGVTLYFFVYGRLPWYSRSLPEIYRMIVEDPVEFPAGPQWAHVPPVVQRLIGGMLDKDPRTRFTIEVMSRCTWVTDDGQWCPLRELEAAGAACSGYKERPRICDQICNREVAAAINHSVAQPLALAPPGSAAGAALSPEGRAHFLPRVMSRLATWRKELKRKCDAKKEAKRARKMRREEAAHPVAATRDLPEAARPVETVASIRSTDVSSSSSSGSGSGSGSSTLSSSI